MFITYIILISIMSFVTYVLYFIDKKRAMRNYNPRISEKTLLLSSFFFGALGGLVAIYSLRHKTKHWYFPLVNILSLAFHIALLYLIITKVGITGFEDFLGNLK